MWEPMQIKLGVKIRKRKFVSVLQFSNTFDIDDGEPASWATRSISEMLNVSHVELCPKDNCLYFRINDTLDPRVSPHWTFVLGIDKLSWLKRSTFTPGSRLWQFLVMTCPYNQKGLSWNTSLIYLDDVVREAAWSIIEAKSQDVLFL